MICPECADVDDHWHVIDHAGQPAIEYKTAHGPAVPTVIRHEMMIQRILDARIAKAALAV